MPPQRARLHPWSRQRLPVLVHRQTPMIYPSRICCKHLLPSSALLSLTPRLLRSVQQCYPSCSRTRLIRTLSAYATCALFSASVAAATATAAVYMHTPHLLTPDPPWTFPLYTTAAFATNTCYDPRSAAHISLTPPSHTFSVALSLVLVLLHPPCAARRLNRTLYLAVFLFLPS